MRPSDHSSSRSVAPSIKGRPDASVDENISRFLTTSARYFELPADQLERLYQHNNFKIPTKEQS